MKLDFSKWGPLTVLIVVIVALFTAGGVAVVIVHPETLSFDQLFSKVTTFVLGLTGLAASHAVVQAVHEHGRWATVQGGNAGYARKAVSAQDMADVADVTFPTGTGRVRMLPVEYEDPPDAGFADPALDEPGYEGQLGGTPVENHVGLA